MDELFFPPTAAYHAKCASSHSGTQRLLIKTAKLDSHGEALTELLFFLYLAASQVQGSVPVLIQQCQVSLGSVKKDGWTAQRQLFLRLLW